MTNPSPPLGSIGWIDLTIPDAAPVRDFYTAVAGWTPSALSMGDYDDYVMLRPDGEPATGVCHARGVNAAMPPHWIMYVVVADLDARLAAVEPNGGTVMIPTRSMGASGRFALVRDPAGAVFALWESAESPVD